MMTATLRAKFPRKKSSLKSPKGRKVIHAGLNAEGFRRMAEHKKKMEFRLRKGKWATLQAEDTIVFTNDDDPTQTLRVAVQAVLNYPSLNTLLADFDAQEYTDRNKEELVERIIKKTKKSKKGYYTKAQEAKHGIIGIKVWYFEFS